MKGLAVKKTKKHAPYIHNLDRLAVLSDLSFTKEQRCDLGVISEFNMATRYDNIKFNFYKKATRDYTRQYYQVTQKFYLWLEKEFLKK